MGQGQRVFTATGPASEDAGLWENPLWYKDGIIYELHVRAFCDSNGDGVGDFKGLAQRLDYLQDLGVTSIWLLPFYPSPLRDDGYDISSYKSIHASYGSLSDFRQFLKEAHRRGLRVITELVLNHTSDQHAWFQRSRREKPGSPWRDYYVWSDTPDRYKDARVIFKDFETSNWAWDQGAGAYGVAGIPQPKPGAVTKAHGGILFVDEIGELHPIQMNKLLKVLEDRKVFLESAYYSSEDTNIPLHEIGRAHV